MPSLPAATTSPPIVPGGRRSTSPHPETGKAPSTYATSRPPCASTGINVAALTTINPAGSLRGTIANTLSMTVNLADSGIQMVLEGAGTMVVDVSREQVGRAGEQSPRADPNRRCNATDQDSGWTAAVRLVGARSSPGPESGRPSPAMGWARCTPAGANWAARTSCARRCGLANAVAKVGPLGRKRPRLWPTGRTGHADGVSHVSDRLA
jgi:hypothetical protein